MSNLKKATLVGCLLRSAVSLWGIIQAIMLLTSPSAEMEEALSQSGLGENSAEMVKSLASGLVVTSLVISLVFCAICWLGYFKIEKSSGKGWKIFFLVYGILMIVTNILGILADPINAILSIATGVVFILVFTTKGEPEEE
ncbi:hypothetical protein SAMN02745116_01472 [Pilibacter termitis]|uniref:Uncharacterized protein n=1 Tax=Pilibacter termitis TaxID=263852 RepID=A0A1T4NLX9_9ENTE|nr:hypothetical protein [Pilibacter termitis]SJZ80097.1 hypothetical protein SAMN02745116_01472 [Pilibacter termitis]